MCRIIPIRHQSGDTIVEALVTVAVLSLVLVVAYATSNRSLQGVEDAGERDEAQNLVSSQIESLRGVNPTVLNTIFSQSDKFNFCLAQDSATHTFARYDLTGNDALVLPALNADELSSPTYPNQCQNSRYFLSITYNKTQNDLFTFRARWDALHGGRDEVTMFYRYHPPIQAASSAPSTSVCMATTFGGLDIAKKANGDPQSHVWYRLSGPNHYTNATWVYTLNGAQRGGFSAGCAANVSITTGDPGHPTTDVQDNERLFAIFKNASGNILCVTPPTPDLPDNQSIMGPNSVGTCTFSTPPASIVFAHCSLYASYTGDNSYTSGCTDSTNSINPVSISFSSP